MPSWPFRSTPTLSRPIGRFWGLFPGCSLAALEAIEASEVDAFVGRDMRLTFGDCHIDFTTTYAILRWKGIPLGKRDFTGKLCLKR